MNQSQLVASPSKFVYMNLEVQDGERRYSCKSVHEIAGNIDPMAAADKHASMFYFGTPEKESESYFFNGGEIAVTVKGAREINKYEYDVLSNFL